MSAKVIYSGSITLSKLKSAIITGKNKEGNPIKGLFIPFEPNYLEVNEKGAVYMSLSIIVHEQPDQYDQDGFIAQRAPSKLYREADEATKEKFKELPIIGNFRNFGVHGNASETAPEAGLDDLPF